MARTIKVIALSLLKARMRTSKGTVSGKIRRGCFEEEENPCVKTTSVANARSLSNARDAPPPLLQQAIALLSKLTIVLLAIMLPLQHNEYMRLRELVNNGAASAPRSNAYLIVYKFAFSEIVVWSVHSTPHSSCTYFKHCKSAIACSMIRGPKG